MYIIRNQISFLQGAERLTKDVIKDMFYAFLCGVGTVAAGLLVVCCWYLMIYFFNLSWLNIGM
jgi:hypothetical protein